MIVIICFVIFSTVSAAQMSVSIANTSVVSGSSINVPITVSGADGLGSMDVVVLFDPAELSVISVDKGALDKGLFLANSSVPGKIAISIVDPSGMSGDGAVAMLSLMVIGSPGTSSPVILNTVTAFSSKSGTDIAVVKNPGNISITSERLSIPGFSPVLVVTGIFFIVWLNLRKNVIAEEHLT